VLKQSYRLKQPVETLQYAGKRNIHQINHNCDYKGSNGYYDCAVLQLTPCWPGYFMHPLVITFIKIVADTELCHLRKFNLHGW